VITTVVPLNEICVPLANLEYIAGSDVVAVVVVVAAGVDVVAGDGAAVDEDEEPQCSSGSAPAISAAVVENFRVMAAHYRGRTLSRDVHGRRQW
jgi:hypothetical protein